jgi:hypothetical protein
LGHLLILKGERQKEDGKKLRISRQRLEKVAKRGIGEW